MRKYIGRKRWSKVFAVVLCLSMAVSEPSVTAFAETVSEEIIVEDRETLSEVYEEERTVSEDGTTTDIVSNQEISGNEVSENQISANSVSEDTVSEDAAEYEYIDGVLPEDLEIESLEEQIGVLGDSRNKSAGIAQYEDVVGTELPRQYDARDVDGKNYVTAPGNQLESNLCWAFSMASIAETNLIKKGFASAENLKISPEHLGYFFYHHVDDELSGTVGASAEIAVSGKNYYTLGGNTTCGTFELAGWIGAAEEEKAPFLSGPQTHDNSLAYDDIAHMQNAYWVSASDRSYVKSLIQEYGSATINCVLSSSGIRSCEDGTASYLYVGNRTVGHAVTIIGWDDDYPAENFRSFGSSDEALNNKPANENGAWLIKDSYTGEGNRVDGCFYMSYEDSALGYDTTNAVTYDMESADNYDHNYQYDGAYGLRSMAFNDTIYGANVYQAKGNQDANGAERIEAVSFATQSTDAEYSIQIYKGLKDPASDPISGKAAFTTEQTGSFAYAGYHTVKLKTPVSVEEGEYFSVVVKISKPQGTAVLMTDESYSNGWANYTAAVKKGRSFYGTNGVTWYDAYDRSVSGVSRPSVMRIKAFTSDYTMEGPFYIDTDMVADIGTQTYTGNQLTPKVDVYYGGKELTEGKEYVVSYGKNTYPGTKGGQVTIKGIGNYITRTPIVKYFDIAKKNINDDDIIIEGTEPCYYNGAAQEPIIVKHNGTVLGSGSVSVTYKKNQSAGTATATIKGNGNYTGSRKVSFSILMQNIASETISVNKIKDQRYTGKPIEVVPVIRDMQSGTELKKNRDYTVSCRKNIMPGTAEAVIIGKGSYTGKMTVPFTILPRDIAKLPMTSIKAQPYNGGLTVRPEIIIKDGDVTLKENVHFTAVYSDNTDVGTASISIEGKEGTIYAGSRKTVSFVIAPFNIATGTKLSNVGDKTYINGQKVYTQNPVLMLPDGRILTKDQDYTVKYSDNTSKGTATMTIEAVGPNYTGSIIRNFRITDKISLTDYADENLVVKGFTYDRRYLFSKRNVGKNNKNNFEVKPQLTLTYKGVTLEEGKDYTVSYRNCNKVGMASAVITATSGGRFDGTRIEEYYIVGRPIFPLGLDTGFALSEPQDKIYTGDEIKQEIVLTEQVKTEGAEKAKVVRRKEGSSYIVKYQNNVNAGTATYTITGIGDYSGSAEFQFQIEPRDLSTCLATKVKTQQYTGEEIRPGIYLKYGNHYLVEGKDYDVTYLDNLQQGTARVVFTACRDSKNFVGTKTVTFAIKKTSLGKLKYGTDIEEIPDEVYDGTQKKPVPVLSYEGRIIPEDQYSVKYGTNTKIGYGTITVTALPESNFTGSKTIKFKITGKPLNVSAEYDGEELFYTGKNIRPALEQIETLDGEILTQGKDYKIKYKKCINAGDGYFYLQGTGDYKGSGKVIHFTIQKCTVKDCVIKGLDKPVRIGAETQVRPNFTVTVNGRKLKKGKDYTVTYLNNQSVGTASVKIRFIGNYDGTFSKDFTIR